MNGLPFSTMADSTGGGRQIDGFHGLSLEYMRSPKFLSADGGYSRVVWMPADLKEQMRSFIPAELVESIATEKDVKNVDELRGFLADRSHPATKSWNKEEEATEEEQVEAPGHIDMPVFQAGDVPVNFGGIKIILKNARISADRAVIQWNKPKKPGAGE